MEHPPSTSSSNRYTIFVRDEEFTLSRSQVEFDSPNYFTSIFLDDFAEGDGKLTTIHVDRNPTLFAIIVEYLSGYTLEFPISSKALPRTMDVRTAMLALADDAAFYGLDKLHALITSPRKPKIDFSWTGLSGQVVSFEDVLRGSLPESVSYTASGLCSFDDGGSVKPVLIFAKNIALRLLGNPNLDKNGRPGPDPRNNSSSSSNSEDAEPTASYHFLLPRAARSQLERQPRRYSCSLAFEFDDDDNNSKVNVPHHALRVSVLPESRIRVDDGLGGDRGAQTCRLEQFSSWWRARRAPFRAPVLDPPAEDKQGELIFDRAFPRPFEDAARRIDLDRTEFVLWADEVMFIITGRGFIAGTLQLRVKLLDVRARTRAAVLDSLRPPYLTD